MASDLAKIIHDALCDDGDKCKRYITEHSRGNTHYTYYQRHANNVMKGIAPIAGEKNVNKVVKVVLDELL
jgi:hypothetical protein